MNLQQISRLPDDIAAPPLGAPINRPQPKPADPGHWVKAATPGYLLHTGTRTMSREQDVPVSERPTKPTPGLYLESGEFVPAEDLNKPASRDDGPCGVVPSFVDLMAAYRAAVERGAARPWELMYEATGTGAWVSIPADRRADVIAALNAL